jgi:hypothetical protein
MSTSDGSSSRMVDVTVSSDTFMQIKPEEIDLYRRGNPNQMVMGLSPSKLVVQSGTTGEVSLGAMAVISLTNGDIVKIMEKIEKLVLDIPEGMDKKLNAIFADEKKQKGSSLTPGTLRIFGSNRACFYTGRSWRGIRLNRSGS